MSGVIMVWEIRKQVYIHLFILQSSSIILYTFSKSNLVFFHSNRSEGEKIYRNLSRD
jgi:hypothetical protein